MSRPKPCMQPLLDWLLSRRPLLKALCTEYGVWPDFNYAEFWFESDAMASPQRFRVQVAPGAERDMIEAGLVECEKLVAQHLKGVKAP